MGDRFSGHGVPGGEYKQAKLAWLDRWVGGVKNGILQSLPPVTSQTASSAGAGEFLAGPAPRTTAVALSSTDGLALVPGRAPTAAGPDVSFSVAGSGTAIASSWCPSR
jgi:hypothetical protein